MTKAMFNGILIDTESVIYPVDGRISFYNKAHTYRDRKNIVYLKSYSTIVCYNKNGQIYRCVDDISLTTGRHIKSFCGLNKREFLKCPKG